MMTYIPHFFTCEHGLVQIISEELWGVPRRKTLPLCKQKPTKLMDFVSTAKLFMMVQTLGWLNPYSFLDSGSASVGRLIFILYFMQTTHIQQQENNVIRELELKKTRKGWIGNKIKEVHLRDDIPCGFQLCPEHQSNHVFTQDLFSQEQFYLIDTYTLIHQTDIIYNSDEIKNIVVLQSSIEKLRNYNPISSDKIRKQKNASINKYNAFKNFVESIELSNERHLFVLADNYHRGIRGNQVPYHEKQMQVESQKQKSGDFDELTHLESVIQWYRRHAQEIGLKKIKFSILTANDELLKHKQSKSSLPITSLLQLLYKTNSNLLDFMGFQVDDSIFKSEVFEQHLQIGSAIDGVREGKLFEGKFMNEKSYFKIGNKIIKLALKNNRALFGDVVIIELNNKEIWKQKFAKGVIQDETIEATNQILEVPKVSQGNLGLIQYLDRNTHLQPSGKVVAIYKKQQRNYCGSIDHSKVIYSSKQSKMKDEQDSSREFQIYEFVPADNKYSNFYIRTYKIDQIRNKRIIVSFDKWPKTSKYPLCHFVKVIGTIGDNKAEADTILLQHNVEIREFSKAAYDCLPPGGDNFVIPPEQLSYRIDLRTVDVVSIDPPGCKDIDDALHCITLPNGNLQIGVHIADVSYYVRPDSALDLQARNRCTTVYLVDRRTDMLPKLLTENLCSLRSNVDRLSFSTIWEVDKDANIINTKYCKTIIRSRRAFTYGQAQQIMDSEDQGSVAKAIRNLNMVAKKLKQKRIENGALTLASTQVKITLEEETHSATDVKMYEMMETNYLIEEFMLLSNIAVAEKIYERFPALSILRRHAPPKMNDLQTLKEIMNQFGYDFKYETSRDLADCLNLVTRSEDEFFNKLVRIMTTRCMNEATYFCSADFDARQFYHYGLAAPFYTHFTSPIRRYADVLVHRLLAAAIDLEPLPTFMINKIKMTKICEQMNMRNRMARYASRASSDYHTYQYFKEKNNEEEAIITAIEEQTATVMLTKYGLQCKIPLSEKDISHTKKMNEGKGIFYKVEIEGKTYKLFDYLKVLVNVQLKGFHKVMNLQIV